MRIEKGDLALVHAQALPDAVSEHEAAVEHRYYRLGAWRHDAIDIDQNILVARIGAKVMCSFSHGF